MSRYVDRLDRRALYRLLRATGQDTEEFRQVRAWLAQHDADWLAEREAGR